ISILCSFISTITLSVIVYFFTLSMIYNIVSLVSRDLGTLNSILPLSTLIDMPVFIFVYFLVVVFHLGDLPAHIIILFTTLHKFSRESILCIDVIFLTISGASKGSAAEYNSARMLSMLRLMPNSALSAMSWFLRNMLDMPPILTPRSFLIFDNASNDSTMSYVFSSIM